LRTNPLLGVTSPRFFHPPQAGWLGVVRFFSATVAFLFVPPAAGARVHRPRGCAPRTALSTVCSRRWLFVLRRSAEASATALAVQLSPQRLPASASTAAGDGHDPAGPTPACASGGVGASPAAVGTTVTATEEERRLSAHFRSALPTWRPERQAAHPVKRLVSSALCARSIWEAQQTGRSDTPCEDAVPSHHIFAISRGDFAAKKIRSPTPCEETLTCPACEDLCRTPRRTAPALQDRTRAG
jgi:hypothetical protein